MHAPKRAAGDDFLHLAVVDAVAVLMTYDSLHARFANEVAHREELVACESDRLFKGDQFRARLDPELDHVQAHGRWRAEAENVGPHGERERTGVAARRHRPQFGQGVLQACRVTARKADQFKTRVGLEERGVVQPALAQADDENAIDIHLDVTYPIRGTTPLASQRGVKTSRQ